MAGTVLFLGAGATKSIKGPMTDEILPAVFAKKLRLSAEDTRGRVKKLVQLLETDFHVIAGQPKEHYPGLPLFMSLLDTALERREVFTQWDVTTLAELREAIEIGMFDVLEQALDKFPTNNHFHLLNREFPAPEIPRVITTNYDLVADAALIEVSKTRQPPGALPNYHCALSNIDALATLPRFGSVLKLHGSLNWLFCRTCQRLELGATASTGFLSKLKAVHDLKSSLTADGAPCSVCGRPLRPLLVAPSHLKDYRNPHLSQVWYEAQRVLRQADRVVFVGYSLPDDDVEVVYLLKRGLAHLTDPKQFTVIEYCKENPGIPLAEHSVGRRYRALFGDVDWCAAGLDAWLSNGCAARPNEESLGTPTAARKRLLQLGNAEP
jgi:NAD-dependent SIR2 family protein deacetylase